MFSRGTRMMPWQRSGGLVTRGMATKVPLTLHSLEGRYATALWSAASKQNALDNVAAEASSLRTALSKDVKLAGFLQDPSIPKTTKLATLHKALKAQGASNTMLNFFETLAENGRLPHTSKVLEEFDTLMKAHKNVVDIVVTSSQELDAKYFKKLSDVLETLIEKGSNPNIIRKTDPSILGGLIVEVGDKVIDMSVASRVAKMNQRLSEPV